jgi:cytochrome P450
MKKLTTYVLCLLIAVLPACQAFTPQQIESGKIAVQDAYDKKLITRQQRDDAIVALENRGFDLTALFSSPVVQILLSTLLGVPIAVGVVQKKRGPTEAQRQAARKA